MISRRIWITWSISLATHRRSACPAGDHDAPAEAASPTYPGHKDSGSGAAQVGGNMRITKYTWDPQQPGQSVSGLSQLPCADANCAVGFIGDYFGLAISGHNIYALFVSTHYPSDVTANVGSGRGSEEGWSRASGPGTRILTTDAAARIDWHRLASSRIKPGKMVLIVR